MQVGGAYMPGMHANDQEGVKSRGIQWGAAGVFILKGIKQGVGLGGMVLGTSLSCAWTAIRRGTTLLKTSITVQTVLLLLNICYFTAGTPHNIP